MTRARAIWGHLRRVIGPACLVLVCVAGAACSQTVRANDNLIESGAAFYNGAVPLPAHLTGDTDVLPVVASRCVNCHVRPAKASETIVLALAADQASSGRPYAAALSREWLVTARQRHGGPATQYDSASFCTLIRTGEDPAHVLIPPVMPRYDATDEQCNSLWAYLRSLE